jgi:hypothetical protein
MIKNLYFLFLIRFRKIVSKDDYFAIALILLLYFCSAIIIYMNYEKLNNYMYLFLIDLLVKHVNRSDITFLKLNKNYKILLFLEYLIYLLPFYIIFLLKKEFLIFSGFILFQIVLLNMPRINLKTIPYPFQLFNPFWHINFRKYKLVFFLPIIFGLIYMSIISNNDNIIYFTFIILGIISCLPSFERETLEEIKLNPFNSKKYISYQFKNSIINTTYLTIPIAILLCFLLKWEQLFFLLAIFIIPLVNILLKYVFFSNSLLHQISFLFFAGFTITFFGIPLLITPYLYKKAIVNLNAIKYANH